MACFKRHDFVRFKLKRKYICGVVEEVLPDKLVVLSFAQSVRYVAEKSKAEQLKPAYIGKEEYRKLVRYEKTLYGTDKDNEPHNIINKDGYVPTLDDLYCALKRIVRERKTPDAISMEWAIYFLSKFDAGKVDHGDNTFYNDATVMVNAKRDIVGAIYTDDEIDLSKTVCNIEEYLKNKDLPLFERNFPKTVKVRLLRSLETKAALDAADEDTVKLYVKFSEELCREGDKDGLLAVGYGCYGGNRAFECDWKRSEECMLRLFETVANLPDRAYYANTLGYIYYYGRCNDGVPEDEKAYKYFSYAAFNHIFEAEYKIADMYQNGYGVEKCLNTARNIIKKLYETSLDSFKTGWTDSNLADVALRMSGFCKSEEVSGCPDYHAMLKYALQAEFAIRLRRIEHDRYGDSTVQKNILSMLEEAKSKIEINPEAKITCDISEFFDEYLSGDFPFDIKPKKMKYGKYKLEISPHKTETSRFKRLFVTIPELGVCGFYKSITVTLVTPTWTDVEIPDEPFTVDKIDNNIFIWLNDGKIVASLHYGCCFEVRKPKESFRKYRFVVFYSDVSKHPMKGLCDDESVKLGDRVKALEKGIFYPYGRVERIFEKADNELDLPPMAYYKAEKAPEE